jgi:hypothetical protein
MTSARLPCLAEKVIADLAQIGKTNAPRMLAHSRNQISNGCHGQIVSLLISFVKGCGVASRWLNENS